MTHRKSNDGLSRLYERTDWVNCFCSICKKPKKGRCSMTADGALAVCYNETRNAINIRDGVIGRYGTYILDMAALKARQEQFGQISCYTQHVKPHDKLKAGSVSKITRETEELLNSVYADLLKCWTLSDDHRDYLHRRGFSDLQIERQQYRTSSNALKVIDDLTAKYGADLVRVPGFEQCAGRIELLTDGKLMIPTFNVNRHLINFRIRVTHQTSSKLRYYYLSSHSDAKPMGLKAYMSAHVIVPEIVNDKRIWVTEGELKAHLASDLLHARFVSIPGVGCWRLALEALEVLSPQTVVIAFDQDLFENPDVANSLLNLFKTLKEQSYEVTIAKW